MDYHQPQSNEQGDGLELVDEKEQNHSSIEEPLPTTTVPVDEQNEARATEKADAIRRACDLRDFDALVSYATSEGGFLNDDVRRVAWPILLQCDRRESIHDFTSWEDLPPHADEEQIQLDVNRSFVYYPECSDEELLTKKDELSRLIKQVLRKYPMLCYFQGYHDIVQVLLLVLGGHEAASAVAQISLLRIRDYMLPTLSPALKHLHLLPAIIEKADSSLRQHLAGIQPFFALAATLTLYAHDIQEYSDIARLFDFLLAEEPVVPVYLFAAIILSRKKELLEISLEEPEMLHFTLSKLPNPLDLDGLINSTVQLFRDYPPESLPFGAWKQIPSCSALKTSRGIVPTHSKDEALKCFGQQLRQLRYEESKEKAITFLWHNRRTIGSVAVTVLIGVMSTYIRRKGLDSTIWSYLGRFRSTLQHRGYL
ncbi:TBC domain-containing protein [Aspergillus saccharolyticus JOP 1030-1]|uniref:TBC domain protein n=1 Tax=Aspergillus saccharolyticus JOP 1030-1 TaxID=1450539 RepID=A0A318Z9L5_9EURO|nr:TBC domain protein [Aspergillus saccharolyticus JOP 1030-1]PYH41403.1 TBC domain protein [Aspergillus saccharolyticus JOP 1030-1]